MKNLKELIPFFICSFLLLFVHWMIFAFLPIFLKSIGLTDYHIGIVIGVFSISSILVVLPAGFLSDIISPKKIAMASSFLFILYIIGLSRFHGYYQLIILAFVGGIGYSALNIILYSLFLKVMGFELRGKKIAFFQAGAYIGFGCGPLAGGLVVQYFSFSALFIAAMIFSVALFAVTFLLKDSDSLKVEHSVPSIKLTDSKIVLLLAISLVYATHFGVEQISFSLLMKEKLGFTGNRIGMVFFILGIWMALLSPVAGHSFDKSRNITKLLITGLVSSSLFQIATGFVTSFEQVIIIRVLHTLGDAFVILSIGILTSELFPEQRMGGVTSIVNITRTLGIFLGNIGSGFSNQLLSYDLSLIINGASVLMFTVMIISPIKKRFAL